MTVPILTLTGSPRDIGRQHGEGVRGLIHDNLRFYMDLWQHMGGVSKEKILSDVEPFVPFVRQLDPDLIEEMEGIAEGANLEFREIAALNARTELTFACLPNTLKESSAGGCTSFGLLPETTEQRHLQNQSPGAAQCLGCGRRRLVSLVGEPTSPAVPNQLLG